MKSAGSVLIIDRDPELAAILESVLGIFGYKVQFTTRVPEAVRRLGNQVYDHILVDPDLKPDSIEQLYDELTLAGGMNVKTPLTLMTSNQNFLVPMSVIKRLSSILIKPFSLEELVFRVKG